MFTHEGGMPSVDYNTSRERLRADAVSKAMRMDNVRPKRPRTNTVFPRDPDPNEDVVYHNEMYRGGVGRGHTRTVPGEAPGSLIAPAMDEITGPGNFRFPGETPSYNMIPRTMNGGLDRARGLLGVDAGGFAPGGAAGLFGGFPGVGQDDNYLNPVAPTLDSGFGQQVDPTVLLYMLRQLSEARRGQVLGGMVPGNHNSVPRY